MLSQFGLPLPSPKDKIFAPGIIFTAIAQGLKQRGHEVTLYTPADSVVPGVKINSFGIKTAHYHAKELGEDGFRYHHTQHTLYLASKAFLDYSSGKYDLMLSDTFPIISYFSEFVSGPIVCIHHGVASKEHDLKYDIDRIRQKRYYDRIKFVAITNKQRQMGKEFFNYIETIHHGLDLKQFKFSPSPSKDLLFLGRINPRKGTDIAIDVTLETGRKLEIWGDHQNDDYWKQKVEPKINNDNIRYRGHCEYNRVGEVYGQSKALLVPISWDEPFGLVVIESMACGTPVIAFGRGSIPELIVDGVTGFVIEPGNKKAFVEAVKKIDQIDRKKCREHVEKFFSFERMVDDYGKLFLKMIKKNKK